jgi:sodium-dependent dicarboxylate transporter 2/3/5
VAVIFGTTAVLWMTRPLLSGWLPALQLSDTTIAIAAAVAFFFVPNGTPAGGTLLTWRYAERLPWGVLLLFGGGLSLAAAVADSGLAAWIAGSLGGLQDWPVMLLVLAVTVMILLLTELTSNIATTATFLPLVAALAISLGQNPMMLALPAALAASGAFMLPVATPPNAIVFGSGCLTIPQMVRAGIWLNLISVIMIVAVVNLLLVPVFSG